MKRLFAVLLLLGAIVGPRPAYAYSVGEFIGDIDKQVAFTVFDTISGAWFYNTARGRSEAGVVAHAITFCKYFHGDVGYATGYDDKTTGAFMYGASLDVGSVLSDSFPETVKLFRAFVPTPAKRILDALFIGPYIGRDTERNELNGGFYSGLRINFGD